MQMMLVFMLLVIMTAIVTASPVLKEVRVPAVQPPLSTGYPDYFIFALLQCEESDPWTIHGLWPQWNQNKPWPEFCNKSAHFDIKFIEDLLPEMDKVWPNCYAHKLQNQNKKRNAPFFKKNSWNRRLQEDPNLSFWEHEYLKHGSCTPWTEHQYFSAALNAYKTYHTCPNQNQEQKLPVLKDKECKFHIPAPSPNNVTNNQ